MLNKPIVLRFVYQKCSLFVGSLFTYFKLTKGEYWYSNGHFVAAVFLELLLVDSKLNCCGYIFCWSTYLLFNWLYQHWHMTYSAYSAGDTLCLLFLVIPRLCIHLSSLTSRILWAVLTVVTFCCVSEEHRFFWIPSKLINCEFTGCKHTQANTQRDTLMTGHPSPCRGGFFLERTDPSQTWKGRNCQHEEGWE